MEKYERMWKVLKKTLGDMKVKLPDVADEMELFEGIMSGVEEFVKQEEA